MSRLETDSGDTTELDDDIPCFSVGYELSIPVYTTTLEVRARGVPADEESPI